MKCNTSDRFIPLSQKQIRNIVASLYKKAGITKKCNPHMLRHSAITYMASLNASETDLSYRFWGIPHSAMVTTYIHLSKQQQSDAYRNIKGMGDKKVAINPLASRCVECGDHIISGSLCPKCERIKTLSENEKVNRAKMEDLERKLGEYREIVGDVTGIKKQMEEFKTKMGAFEVTGYQTEVTLYKLKNNLDKDSKD